MSAKPTLDSGIAGVGPWAIDPFNNKNGPFTTEIAILNLERMAH